MRLRDAPLGTALTLLPCSVPADVGRRLAMLGIRPGATLRLLCRTAGGGLVAKADETRVALGSTLCQSLRVKTAIE